MSDTDPTAPWYEFISYIRCCESLGVTPSLQHYAESKIYIELLGVI